MRKANWVLLIIFLLAISCQKPENVDSAKNVASKNEVREDDALLISSNFSELVGISNNSNVANANARTDAGEKNVKRVKTFRDSQQNALYYVITYDGGGFIVVSAEKRARPILAFSNTSEFPLDQELPAGVKEFMRSYAESIQELRSTNAAPDSNIVAEWKRLENTTEITKLIERSKNAGGRVLDQPVDPGCQDSQILVNLNTSKWGPGGGMECQYAAAIAV